MTRADTSITGAAAQMGLSFGAGTFCHAVLQAAEKRPEIVALSADVSKYTDLYAFSQIYPQRFINVGMAEQNLVMVASGLARAGLVPVATTFAAFLTRRATDFTIMQVALPKANVKLIGGVPGISSSFGPSHASIDDLATMRAIPHLVVLDPADTVELGEATTAALDYDGPVYLRQPFVTHDRDQASQAREPFRIGRNVWLRRGGDVGIVASGFLVKEAMHAAELLAAAGIQASVLKVSTLKPFDRDSLLELAASTRALITAENHSVIGGLFSTVAETLAREGVAIKTRAIGVQDCFPPFGGRDYLAEQLGMNGRAIAAAARELLG